MNDAVEKATTSTALSKTPKGSRGFEEATEEDLVQPRLKIGQGLSPVVKDGGVKLGELYNSITQLSYGEELVIQPVFFFKSRIKWLPRDEEGDIDCRAMDAKVGDKYKDCTACAFKEWGTDDNGENIPPPCTEIYNFLSMVRDQKDKTLNGQLVVVSYMKTTFSEGRQILSKMRYSGGDMFSKKYRIFTRETKNALGEFFVYASDAGIAVEKDEYAQALSAYGDWFNVRYEMQVDMDSEEDIPTDNKDEFTKTDTAKATKQEKAEADAVAKEETLEF